MMPFRPMRELFVLAMQPFVTFASCAGVADAIVPKHTCVPGVRRAARE